MGTCCSCQRVQNYGGVIVDDDIDVHHGGRRREIIEEEDLVEHGDYGARIRLGGSSKYISMFSQQGKKGVNQDAMAVWENFGGDRDTVFLGVFDGHGPYGHKVARHIRDNLPSKISLIARNSKINGGYCGNVVDDDQNDNLDDQNPLLSSWKASLLKSFKEMDEDLEGEVGIDTYCSGTTSVSVLKKGRHLIISNLGDSRAVLCTRNERDQLVSVQLTVDLKPNLPIESERIKSSGGRVIAMEQEPSVYRVWMPDQDCPGLAMARAFGDFCLKDFGLISTPEVYYRKLTDQDEFVVLATDGVWDVLSNNEVIRIVASVRKRHMAARVLVDWAVRAWRYKYPCSKVDDCAVICLFFKRPRPLLTKSISEKSELSLNYSELGAHPHNTKEPRETTDDGLDTVLNCDIKEETTEDIKAAANEGGGAIVEEVLVTAVNRPRGSGFAERRRSSSKEFDSV